MEFPDLPGRLARVRETVARHQAVAGWKHPVRIIAVTKGHGPEAVRAAYAAGVEDVGENRVQEAIAKQEQVGNVPVRWHLIGTLQRNKARHTVGRFALVHSFAILSHPLALVAARRTYCACISAANHFARVAWNSGEASQGATNALSEG